MDNTNRFNQNITMIGSGFLLFLLLLKAKTFETPVWWLSKKMGSTFIIILEKGRRVFFHETNSKEKGEHEIRDFFEKWKQRVPTLCDSNFFPIIDTTRSFQIFFKSKEWSVKMSIFSRENYIKSKAAILNNRSHIRFSINEVRVFFSDNKCKNKEIDWISNEMKKWISIITSENK